MTTATQTQLRRDTATNLNAATPAAGEPGWDITNKRLVVGDGSTAGGIKVTMAKDYQNQTYLNGTVGGTGDVITITNSPAKTALASGQKLSFKATADNTTAVTINEDGLGAKNAKFWFNGSLTSLPAAAIKSGSTIEGEYDGTQYQITAGLNLTASSTVPGICKPDGTTITASGGVLSTASQLMTPLGVGSIVLASGSGQSAGGTASGAVLTCKTVGGSATGDTLSGTWKALQTQVNGASDIILWQRTV